MKEIVSFSLSSDLLEMIDKLARVLGKSRSAIVEKFLFDTISKIPKEDLQKINGLKKEIDSIFGELK